MTPLSLTLKTLALEVRRCLFPTAANPESRARRALRPQYFCSRKCSRAPRRSRLDADDAQPFRQPDADPRGLIELAAIGIIDLLPNRGAVVRPVTTKDVRDILDVRAALECKAVRRACGRIDAVELEEIAAELRDLMNCSPSELSDFMQRSRAVDSRLHDLIAESCGNRYLVNELNRLRILFRAFRDVTYSRRKANVGCARLAEEAREHLAIVEGLQQEDAKVASKAMARHMRSGVKYWSRIMPAAEEEARRAEKKNGIRGSV